MVYNFTAQWTKGSNNSAPDALSHYPVSDPNTEDTIAEYDNQHNPEVSTAEIRAITATEPFTTSHLQKLQDKAIQDPAHQQLQTIIMNGFQITGTNSLNPANNSGM